MFMLYLAQNLSPLYAEVTSSQSQIVKFHKINLYFGNINFQHLWVRNPPYVWEEVPLRTIIL